MLFNSLQFLLFFITVTCLYFALPHRFRWLMLLLASCWFYMAFIPIYILVLFLTIIIDYIAGIYIENAAGNYRKLFLAISILVNVGILAIFKYYNFFAENINILNDSLNTFISLPLLNIILPIGLSFHTFQAMSYTIEVYKGNQKAERNFGIYALYVMFYPQLVAGPIERPQNMLHQFYERHYWNYERFKSGMLLILWGLFKKIVIADRLAIIVNQVYANPAEQTAANIGLAMIFFSFQIYCDFSGYSTIAMGTARIMGFELMENFRTPYFSKSISEFWSRWHISLSTWFRDYLYIPLGGNRVAEGRKYFNLVIVFLVSGLWHGAAWGFIIWGFLHGSFLVISLFRNTYFPVKKSLPPIVQTGIVFGLVTFAWVFFRAASLSTSLTVFNQLFTGDWYINNFSINEVIYCFILIIFLCFREYYYGNAHKNSYFWLKFLLYIVAIYFLGIFSENQFIYFQF